jgi:hypothetical protein
VSDIYTVAARTISGTGGIIGFLGYYDLTWQGQKTMLW